MTPDLQAEGARRWARAQRRDTAGRTASGGRSASFARPLDARQIDTTHGRILYLEEVTVTFDGFRALDRLSLDIGVGELRCIIGPNGAGKTTMMDVITGKTRPDSGRVFLGSTIDLTRHREAEIVRLGVGRKFQKPTVFEALSVWDNLELAVVRHKGVLASVGSRLTAAERTTLESLLETVRLHDHRKRLAGELSHGQKQWLEIGMLLALDPVLLLLDEPVAGMTDEETERTVELLLGLKGRHSLVVVEHDMAFVRALSADGRVTVLHEGRVLAEGSLAQVQADERVIEVYLGR